MENVINLQSNMIHNLIVSRFPFCNLGKNMSFQCKSHGVGYSIQRIMTLPSSLSCDELSFINLC
jgi:hypothetical protein